MLKPAKMETDQPAEQPEGTTASVRSSLAAVESRATRLSSAMSMGLAQIMAMQIELNATMDQFKEVLVKHDAEVLELKRDRAKLEEDR